MTPRPDRLLGLDVARALAIFGMFAAHLLYRFEFFDWATPSTWGDVVNGRSAILFAMLAGVTLALLTGGSHPLDDEVLAPARARLVVRAVVIWTLGCLLTALGTPVEVILQTYGVLFVIGLAVARWRARRLFVAAGILGATAPALLGALAVTQHLGQSELIQYFTGAYPIPVYLVFVLLGMGVGRLDLRSAAVAVRLLVIGVASAAIGYGACVALAPVIPGTPGGGGMAVVDGAPMSGSGTGGSAGGSSSGGPVGNEDDVIPDPTHLIEPSGLADFDWHALVSVTPHSGSYADVIGGAGLAMAIIATCLLVAAKPRILLAPLVAAGSMSLTLYAAHIVLLAILSEAVLVPMKSHDLYLVIGPTLFWSCVVGSMLFAMLWLRRFSRGPLEGAQVRIVDRLIPRS